jgi:hypothetical protein
MFNSLFTPIVIVIIAALLLFGSGIIEGFDLSSIFPSA